ncbi:hypothetical protein AAIG91_34730, partial [Pseudomonas aeruginosa]|uniref:hypothetical protein n=1 Tax=Pseudomonas aeruginosa TaxID=287 RepID=UPI0031B696D5
MTQTLNPVITVTVSGPVGSGKSYVLARIEEMVKQELGNSVIVDAADVENERRMNGEDLTTWQKPRGGTVIRLRNTRDRACCHTARSVSVGRMSCWMLYAPRAGNVDRRT